MEIRVSSIEEAPRKCQIVESGHLDDSKFLQDVPFDFNGSEDSGDCELFKDFFSVSSSSFLDEESYEARDDLKLLEDFSIGTWDQSYKNQADDSISQYNSDPPFGTLSSEDESIGLSTDFSLRTIWLNDGRPCSPIRFATKSALKPTVQEDILEFLEDNIFANTSFIRLSNPDPLFHACPRISNESCRDAQSADRESHPALEAFARRNSFSSFFLREFDFYLKYSKCLDEEKCFACTEQSMSWANYPCCHLLCCDDCRNQIVEAARSSEHKCVICDAKVEKMLHSLNSTSCGKVIPPNCHEITDYKGFSTLDAGILKSPPSSNRKIENEGRHDQVLSHSPSSMDGHQPLTKDFSKPHAEQFEGGTCMKLQSVPSTETL